MSPPKGGRAQAKGPGMSSGLGGAPLQIHSMTKEAEQKDRPGPCPGTPQQFWATGNAGTEPSRGKWQHLPAWLCQSSCPLPPSSSPCPAPPPFPQGSGDKDAGQCPLNTLNSITSAETLFPTKGTFTSTGHHGRDGQAFFEATILPTTTVGRSRLSSA